MIKRLDCTQRQKALAFFEKGVGYRRVATELGISPETAKYWLLRKQAGQFDATLTKDSTFEHIRYSPENRLEIVRAIMQGKTTVRASSKKIWACPKTIRWWIKRYLQSQGCCKTFGWY